MDMYPGPARGGIGYNGGGIARYDFDLSDYGDCWYYYVEGAGHISPRSPSYY